MIQKIIYSLVFVKQNSNILLGLKKRGLGVGKWNGFGGKVENNESLLEAALRELKEESFLTAKTLKQIGVLVYEVSHRSRVDIVHVFTTNDFTGTPAESDEMSPKWFEVKNIPFENMWPDSKLWYPYILNDKYFVAHVIYKNDNDITHDDIKEHESLSSALKAVDKLEFISQ